MPTSLHVRARLTRSADQLSLVTESDGASYEAPAALAAFFLGWVALGLLLARLLVRRGHDARTMTALGVGLGPLLIALVVEGKDATGPMLVRSGTAAGGDLDVLIVLTGEPSDVDQLTPTLRSLDRMAGLITIVTVVAYESCAEPVDTALSDAIDRLTAAGIRLCGWSPRLVVLPGHPRVAPARFARSQGVGLTLHADPRPAANRDLQAPHDIATLTDRRRRARRGGRRA